MDAKEIEYLTKELNYINAMGYNVEEGNYHHLFPGNWYLSDNYDLKSKILEEATQNKILIVDTELFNKEMMEKVVMINEGGIKR